MDNREVKKFDYIEIFVGCMLFFMTYAITNRMVRIEDFAAHTRWANQIDFNNFNSSLEALTIKAYPVWHILVAFFRDLLSISIQYAAIIVAVGFNMFTFVILKKFLNKKLEFSTQGTRSFIAIALMFITPIYVPFFNPHVYLGQISSTVWHNPTNNAVKGFTLLIAILVVRLMNSYKETDKFVGKQEIIIAVLCVFTLFIKPSAMQILIPSIGLFILYKWLFAKEISTRLFFIYVMILSIPTLIILQQTVSIFFSSTVTQNATRNVQFVLFGFWKQFTPNVYISCLISIAFPLFVLIAYYKEAIKDDFYILSLICFVVGYIESIILYDGQTGNFTWGVQLGLFLWFISSIILFTKKIVDFQDNKNERTKLIIGSILFSMHFLSGIYYYIYLLFFAAGQC